MGFSKMDIYMCVYFTHFGRVQARYHLHKIYHHECSWTRSEILQRTYKSNKSL